MMKAATFIAVLSICFVVVPVFLGCHSMPNNDGKYESVHLDGSAEQYGSLGIQKDRIEIWEDGMRTDGKSGSYEWWYTDSEFDDGTTVVVVFYTKDFFDVPGPAKPTVAIDISYPDGRTLRRMVQEADGTVLQASREKADVTIADSFLRYADGDYELYFNDGFVEFRATMKSVLPMWRPETGHCFFGDDKKDFFAWFVAQPSSLVKGYLSVDGEKKQLEGTGYHDHNWGNVPMQKVINHWYWGRAKIGGYDLIAVDIISAGNTGFTRIPIFMIARDGKILEDDQSRTIVARKDTVMHEVTGKFYDNHLQYIQKAGDGTVYTVDMIREKDIVAANLLESLPLFKRFIAWLIGARPSYVRTLGKVKLSIEKDGKSEHYEEEGLWEQMFFGNNKEAYIWN